MKPIHTFIAAAALGACTLASAQNIDRVRMTDNDMSCQNMYDELKIMDSVINSGGAIPQAAGAAPANPAAAAVGNQVVGAVAQQALGQVAARSGLGGLFGGGGAAANTGGGVAGALGGLFGGGGAPAAASGGGGLGGLFGNVLGQVAQNAIAQQQAAPPAAPVAQVNPALVPQAQARKEHLTGMFLGKPCKVSDIKP